MKTSAKVKLYTPVVFSLMILCLSLVLIIVSFSLVYWLHVIQTGDNYGMWQGCEKGGNKCDSWYSNGEKLLNYYMTPSYKAFQSCQTIYLVFTLFAFLLILISLRFFKKNLWVFVLCGLCIFVGTISGIAGLLVYVIDIFKAGTHYLHVCYWLSLSSIVLNLFSLIALLIFTMKLRKIPVETSEADLIKKSNFMTKINSESNTIKEMSQVPIDSSPNVVRIVRTKELQSQPLSDSPKHTHYHSEYDVSKPPKHLNKDKKYQRRFHYRQIHKLAEHKKHKHESEQFQPGYCSEPEIIEYSLDRCWVNADNQVPTSFETIESIDDSFENGHVFPKAIYYDGQERYVHNELD